MEGGKAMFSDNEIIKMWNQQRLFRLEKDRLKKKRYIYSSYADIIYPTLYLNCLPKYFCADTVCRINRSLGYNVINGIGYNDVSKTSFLEQQNKAFYIDLSIDSLKHYQEVLSSSGIGFDAEKIVKENSLEYIAFCQSFFKILFDKGIVSHEIKEEWYSKENEKIVNELELLFNNYEDIEKKLIGGFYLDVKKYVNVIVEKINRLDIQEKYKRLLLKALKPREGITLNLYSVEENIPLEIFLDKPALLGGVDFISLNPKYIDVLPYVDSQEIDSLNSYLTKPSIEGMHSGIRFCNPLTGHDIPLIISNHFDEKIHVGISSISDDDYQICAFLGIESRNVLEDNIIVDSDFISQMNIDEATAAIIKAFCDEDIAKRTTIYEQNKILISQIDSYGILIPTVKMKKSNEILSVDKKNIPIYFSPKFRPVISNEEDLNEGVELVDGTLNSFYTSGLACYASKYVDGKIGIISPFNQEVQYINEQIGVDNLLINSYELIKEVLMPLFFNEIMIDLFNIDCLGEIKKVLIVDEIIDERGLSYCKKNNNLLPVDKCFMRYSSDAFRMFLFQSDIFSKQVNYDLDKIMENDSFLKQVLQKFGEPIVEVSARLELPLRNLVKCINELIAINDYKEIIENIMSFFLKKMVKSPISKPQAIDFLVLISPFMPLTAEKIYQKYFSLGKNFLIYEQWPI